MDKPKAPQPDPLQAIFDSRKAEREQAAADMQTLQKMQAESTARMLEARRKNLSWNRKPNQK
ncbi:hypothetical protein [Rhodoblastus sp.]|uniref:hypothetical protein n=1 Tax=Rhodoblastus sp. TaxID=1962975 RepID=UPI0035B37383